MTRLPYTLDTDDPKVPPRGLIVLDVDETIEADMRHYFAKDPNPLYVTRIPSGATVTKDSLLAMQQALSDAANLLPKARPYPVVGYGCTSASAVIGSEAVETLVQQGCDAVHVTNPLRATVACAGELGVSRFALISPYIEEVNAPLRAAFLLSGIEMGVFGSFGESSEAQVVRISTDSIVQAAMKLGADPSVDAIFLSCTNLRTRDAIAEINQRLGKPVLSSNQALAWHMQRLSAQSLGD